MKRALATAALLVGAAGCALTSRGAVLSVRYFAPAPPPSAPPVARPASSPASSPVSSPVVRLGRVRGAPWLRERIAYRTSAYELGFYDDRAWAERPESFVRSALDRTLFEERGFERALGGAAKALDLDVLAFTELRLPTLHGARVEVRYRIQSDVVVLDEGTIRVDRPVAGGRFEDVVAAMSAALEEVSEKVAERVERVAGR